MACNFSQLRRRQSSGSLHKARPTEEEFKDQFYRNVREKYYWYVLTRLAMMALTWFQRTRSRSRSIGKYQYEGGSARLMKIKQIKQNTEANYQTIHGTNIEPRKPLRVAFSQVSKVSNGMSIWICFNFLTIFSLKGWFRHFRWRCSGGYQGGRWGGGGRRREERWCLWAW